MPLTLTENITAYEKLKSVLEAEKLGKWVVFYDGILEGEFDDFPEAFKFAVERWGRGPYLIREVGRPPFTLPASIKYRRIDSDG